MAGANCGQIWPAIPTQDFTVHAGTTFFAGRRSMALVLSNLSDQTTVAENGKVLQPAAWTHFTKLF